MGALRWEFRTALVQAEDRVLGLGRRVEGMLPQAVETLREGGQDAVQAILTWDDVVDVDAYEIADEVYTVIARQAPVASDLRLLIALLHVVRSIERIGDYCVNLARLRPHDLPEAVEPELDAQVVELGGQAQRTLSVALDAFGRRMKDGVQHTEQVDATVRRLQEGLMQRLMDHAAAGPEATRWSLRMLLATRHLERVGDHAVTIAEQGVFVSTGRHRQPPTRR